MSDKSIHRIALGLIALAFVAKLVSLVLIRELHGSLKFFEFFSIGVYFFYVGWLGFVRKAYRTENGRYMIYATLLVLLDVATYYFFKGWK
jgi:hypothetical protein